MRRALADFRIAGVSTTIPFHQHALAHAAFADGLATVNFIPRYLSGELAMLASAEHRTAAESDQEAGDPRIFMVEVNGRRFDVRVAEKGGSRPSAAQANGRAPSAGAARPRDAKGTKVAAPADGVVSTIQGAILAVRATPGQAVEAGEVLFIIEAMKMENEITAPHAGTIGEVRAQIGQVVEAGATLATYKH